MTAPIEEGLQGTDSEVIEPQETGSAEQESADNPAWAPYREIFEQDDALRPLADKIYGMLTPKLAEQDKKYQELSEKNARFKDYEEFVEAQIPPQYLRQSVQTFNVLNKDPKEFHRILSDNLGISIAEAKELAEDMEEAAEEDDNPQLTVLQRQIEELRQEREAEKNNNEVAKWQTVIDTGIAEVREQHSRGPLAGLPINEKRLFQLMAEQPEQGMDVNPAKAYEAWVEEVNLYRSFPTAGSTAPRITPTSGGATSLPLNDNSGQIPDSVIRSGFDAITKWTKENVLNKPQ